jgi:hypothetical protein
VAGLPFTPCARVEKIDYRSFRSARRIAANVGKLPEVLWKSGNA